MTTATADNARILVVEDDPYLADVVTTALRHLGYRVETASGSDEAVHTATRFRPDLVVLDVILPDGSGLDTCRRLRDRDSRIPVIFLTARDSTDDRIAGQRPDPIQRRLDLLRPRPRSTSSRTEPMSDDFYDAELARHNRHFRTLSVSNPVIECWTSDAAPGRRPVRPLAWLSSAMSWGWTCRRRCSSAPVG